MKLLIQLFLILILTSVPVFADNFQDAKDALMRKNYETAYKLFLPLAELGSPIAQRVLGVLYEYTEVKPQDYQRATKWFRLSAEQQNAIAQYNLGLMHCNGVVKPQDYQEAAKWFRLSAEQGNADAQSKIELLIKLGYIEDSHPYFIENFCPIGLRGYFNDPSPLVG